MEGAQVTLSRDRRRRFDLDFGAGLNKARDFNDRHHRVVAADQARGAAKISTFGQPARRAQAMGLLGTGGLRFPKGTGKLAERVREARVEYSQRLAAGIERLGAHDGAGAREQLDLAQAVWPSPVVASRLAEAKVREWRDRAADAYAARDNRWPRRVPGC